MSHPDYRLAGRDLTFASASFVKYDIAANVIKRFIRASVLTPVLVFIE